MLELLETDKHYSFECLYILLTSTNTTEIIHGSEPSLKEFFIERIKNLTGDITGKKSKHKRKKEVIRLVAGIVEGD